MTSALGCETGGKVHNRKCTRREDNLYGRHARDSTGSDSIYDRDACGAKMSRKLRSPLRLARSVNIPLVGRPDWDETPAGLAARGASTPAVSAMGRGFEGRSSRGRRSDDSSEATSDDASTSGSEGDEWVLEGASDSDVESGGWCARREGRDGARGRLPPRRGASRGELEPILKPSRFAAYGDADRPAPRRGSTRRRTRSSRVVRRDPAQASSRRSPPSPSSRSRA